MPSKSPSVTTDSDDLSRDLKRIRLANINQLARELAVSPRTIRRWMQQAGFHGRYTSAPAHHPAGAFRSRALVGPTAGPPTPSAGLSRHLEGADERWAVMRQVRA